MRKILAVVSMFAVAGFTSLALAGETSVYIQAAQVSGGSAEDGSAVHDLIEASLGEMRDYQVGDSSSKIILKPKLIKLGSAFMVTLEKIVDGKVKFTSQLKAAKPEELDIVCRRLTRAVMDEKAPQTDTKVTEVTQAETVSGTNRKEVIGRWLFGLGPAGLVNLNQTGDVFGITLGYTWEVIEPTAMIKLFYDGTAGFGDLEIGGDYFFSQSNTAAFAGLDLGYGWSQVQGNPPSNITNTSIGGISAGATVGLGFFRLSKMNMELAARYATLFANNSYGLPGTFGLRLSILF